MKQSTETTINPASEVNDPRMYDLVIEAVSGDRAPIGNRIDRGNPIVGMRDDGIFVLAGIVSSFDNPEERNRAAKGIPITRDSNTNHWR